LHLAGISHAFSGASGTGWQSIRCHRVKTLNGTLYVAGTHIGQSDAYITKDRLGFIHIPNSITRYNGRWRFSWSNIGILAIGRLRCCSSRLLEMQELLTTIVIVSGCGIPTGALCDSIPGVDSIHSQCIPIVHLVR
jgi:hypothetical protein